MINLVLCVKNMSSIEPVKCTDFFHLWIGKSLLGYLKYATTPRTSFEISNSMNDLWSSNLCQFKIHECFMEIFISSNIRTIHGVQNDKTFKLII